MIDNSNLKIGFIGVGYLGEIHLKRFLQIAEKNKGINISGIYDINPNRSNDVSNNYKVKPYDDYTTLIAESDGIILATTSDTHYRIAKKVLDNSKHLFVEKPITTNSIDANDLVQTAKEKNLTLQVGHIERFNPAYSVVKTLIQNPLFIELERIAPFKKRGSEVAVVFDLMIHDIDLLLDLIGEMPQSLFSRNVEAISGSADMAFASLSFSDNRTGIIKTSRLSVKPSRKMRVFQKDGYLSVDFAKGEVDYLSLSKPEYPSQMISAGDNLNYYFAQIIPDKVDQISLELEDFISSIRDNRPPLVSGTDGLNALKVAEDILKANKLTI